MKKVTIRAHNGRGEDKVLAGEQAANQPETLEEAIAEYGADTVLGRFWDSHVIFVQNQIRTGTGHGTKSKVNALVVAARKQKAEGDSDLYNQLVYLEIIKD